MKNIIAIPKQVERNLETWKWTTKDFLESRFSPFGCLAEQRPAPLPAMLALLRARGVGRSEPRDTMGDGCHHSHEGYSTPKNAWFSMENPMNIVCEVGEHN